MTEYEKTILGRSISYAVHDKIVFTIISFGFFIYGLYIGFLILGLNMIFVPVI